MKFLISNLRLLMRRFKSVAVINIVGLAVAFAVLLVVAMQVRYDLTYDRGFKHSREIFRMEIDWGTSDWGFSEMSNQQIPELWKARVPEIKDYSLVGFGDTYTIQIEGADGNGEGGASPTHKIEVREVTSGFMNVFSPEIVAGDAKGTFDESGHALIAESTAATIFGAGENPVGQVLVVADNPEIRWVIDAVYRDFPANSSVGNGLFHRAEPNTDPGQYSWSGYVRFDPADRDDILAKVSDSMLLHDAYEGRFSGQKYALTNASEYYLHGGMGSDSRGHFGFTIYLLVIGLVILIVAIINFVNISMAMAPSRVRNININRILGIRPRALRTSLSAEAVVMGAVAVVAGGLAVHWFGTSVFTDFFTADLTLARNIPLVAACASGLLLVTFLVGVYTSRYATSFDVAIALKSSFALSRRGAGLRNTLIVVQFTTAIFFICFSWFVWLQYRHMATHDVGYQRENIVYVPSMADSLSRASFAQEVMKNPRITDATTSGLPGQLGARWSNEIDGQHVSAALWGADYNTLRFFGVGIVAGEDFSAEKGTRQVIFNREFLRKNNLTDDIIGKTFNSLTIVGIAEDVNFESLHQPIAPMSFATWGMNLDWTFLKISGDDVPATLAFIEKTWNSFPADVRRDPWGARQWSLSFLDDELDALYKRELNTSRLIGVLGAMAVLIAVMGVFGLVMFNTRYKTREIAIRKVNGATVGGIALMLNRSMLALVGVAFVVAVPLALVFINRWVAGFAYKAAAPWWLFAGAGLLVLLIAIATVSLQSWRAATANPVRSLKTE
jgi:putative ABC transport system permease protein